ncbi:sporulation histidine kinase inhibitor Sda [Bacillus tianshenii]|nr:sporulation histidine kinase inhibitor Sda [Bacillus tianshenii]
MTKEVKVIVEKMSDKLLVETYEEAQKCEVDERFLQLLEEELVKRELIELEEMN